MILINHIECFKHHPSLLPFQASARGAALPHRGVPAAAQRRVHPGDEQADDGGAGAQDLRARSQAGAGTTLFSAVARFSLVTIQGDPSGSSKPPVDFKT